MATALPIKRGWTYAALKAIPDDGLVYDILGGSLVVRNVPSMDHGDVLTELIELLIRAQLAGYGRMYTSSTAVALDYPSKGEGAIDVPHPDLFFVRSERVGMRGVRGWEGVPDLIIEVLSPSTASDHRPGGRWWSAYERNGVPHSWLVDTQRRVIFRYALAGEPYANGNYHEPATLSGNDLLESALFPTISVAVSEIFRHIGGEPK